MSAAVFDLTAWLSARRSEVDALLDHRLPLPPASEDPGRLVEAMRYSLLAPGKRLRPILALGAAQAVGADPSPAIRLAAAAVELIHCYSLIHDDLPAMDDDDFRRGKPSCHKAFGEATAILAGDALLTLAFEWMAEAGLAAEAAQPHEPSRAAGYLRAAATLARCAGMWGMVRGQSRDLGEHPPTTMASLEELHREKTAALFRGSVAVGAFAGGAASKEQAALERYGDCFGVAFQHADDLADKDHPQLAGAARARAETLVADALAAIEPLGEAAAPLRALAQGLLQRVSQRELQKES